jgi:hypothetical protein
VDTRRMRLENFTQFISDILDRIKSRSPGSMGAKNQADQLEEAFTMLTSNLDYVRKSGFTEKLKKQDEYRDALCQSITGTVKSLLKAPEADVVDAAQQLEIVFDNYWSIPKRSYKDETAAVTDLLRELDTTANVARLALLDLAPAIARFRAAHVKFKELLTGRYLEQANRPSTPANELRELVIERLDAFINRVDAVIEVNGMDFSEDIPDLIKEYNAIATSYKNELAIRQGRLKAARKKNEEEDTDDDIEYEDSGTNVPEVPETPEPLSE